MVEKFESGADNLNDRKPELVIPPILYKLNTKCMTKILNPKDDGSVA